MSCRPSSSERCRASLSLNTRARHATIFDESTGRQDRLPGTTNSPGDLTGGKPLHKKNWAVFWGSIRLQRIAKGINRSQSWNRQFRKTATRGHLEDSKRSPVWESHSGCWLLTPRHHAEDGH